MHGVSQPDPGVTPCSEKTQALPTTTRPAQRSPQTYVPAASASSTMARISSRANCVLVSLAETQQGRQMENTDGCCLCCSGQLAACAA